MKKAVVTGGAGFIGSRFIDLFLKWEADFKIINIDNMTYAGDQGRLDALKNNNRYSFVEGNICNPEDLKPVLDGADAVFHFAAETHVDRSLLNAQIFFQTNAFGTHLLLQESMRAGVKRFVHISTDEVYGSRKNGFFRESDALKPTSPYSISKAPHL